MAVTRINGQKRIAEQSIVEVLLADAAVTEAKIADAAVTPAKLDSTQDYTVNKFTAQDAATLQSTLEVDGDLSAKANLTVDQDASVAGGLTVTGDGSFGGNVVITGNLQVDGDQVIANTSVLEVEDKNITVNKGGNADSMAGAGLSIDNSDNPDEAGSLVYDPNVTSKFKAGIINNEIELVIVSGDQTLEDKKYMLVGEAIEDQDNLEDALRALDDKVNSGTAYKVQEGDTNSSSNYDPDDSDNNHATWSVGEAIEDQSSVHVYVSGVRLRSGILSDLDGSISNDYAVDYAAGKIIFAETPDGNIIVEYIAAS